MPKFKSRNKTKMEFTVEHKLHERQKKVNNFNDKIIIMIKNFPSLKKNTRLAHEKYPPGDINKRTLIP